MLLATLTCTLERTAARTWGPVSELWSCLLTIVYFIKSLLQPPVFSNPSKGIDWTSKDIPSLEGKLAIVTGSNSGIGFETARYLASAGATVILAVRNLSKGIEARNKIVESLNHHARLEVMKLDLSSLSCIEEFATSFREKYDVLDILVNNAGIINSTEETRNTEDGFELIFGTNHLGHFALTANLLPVLRKRPSRVVNVSSLVTHEASINFDDLMSSKRPVGWHTYTQSKLANLLFTQELHRRSINESWGVLSVSAHPGMCGSTEMLKNGYGETSVMAFLTRYFGRFLLASAETAALPVLYAATAEAVSGGSYFGPKNMFETRDGVAPAKLPFEASREDTAERLWNTSVSLTKVKWGDI